MTEQQKYPRTPHLPSSPGATNDDRMWDVATLAGFDALVDSFVIRDAGNITQEQFGVRVAKYVRAGHVTTDAEWRHRDDFELNGIQK